MLMSAFSLVGGHVTGPQGAAKVFLRCSLDLVSLPRDRVRWSRPSVRCCRTLPGAVCWSVRAVPLSCVVLAAARSRPVGVVGPFLRDRAELRWPFMRVVHVLPAVQAGEGPVLELGHQAADP